MATILEQALTTMYAVLSDKENENKKHNRIYVGHHYSQENTT
jgi:hypothetical protein